MKKKIVITLLVGCMLLVTALPHVNAYTKTINNNASNQQILEKELENIVDKQMSTYNWKLNDLSYTKTFEEVNSGKIEMRWDVNIKHTLNYSTPEMVPVLKGKIKAYNEVKNNLDQSKKNVLEKDINKWKDNLQQYINEPQDANESIKVIGELDNKNKIIPNSLSFYIQNDDEYIPMSEALKAKTDIDIEQNSYNNFKDESLGITTNNLIAPAAPIDSYDRKTAVTYANAWVRNTSLACRSGSDVVQDPNNYNSSYTWYQCKDCANFVSQCLYAGSIPQDSTWRPGTNAWINVTYLFNYLTSKSYATTIDSANLFIGDIFRKTKVEHVMIVTYFDGSVIKYNAHSSDRYQTILSSPSGYTFYRIRNWTQPQ